jgi:hypothetical protein
MKICESLLPLSVGFEALTALVMRRASLWDMTPCILCLLFHIGFLLGLLFDPEDGSDIFIQNGV